MYSVKFDFDPVTEAISNVKITKVKSKFEDISSPVVQLTDSKLLLSPSAIELLDVKLGERIGVNYIQKNNELTFPVIGKAEIFGDADTGNKLAKNNTVPFRGTQKTILAKYGQLFELQEYKPGMFRMLQIDESELPSSELQTELKELKEI